MIWSQAILPGMRSAMNMSATDHVVVELSDDHLPAEVLNAWVERTSDID